MDEMNTPVVDNNTTVASEPAYTGTEQPNDAPAAPVTTTEEVETEETEEAETADTTTEEADTTDASEDESTEEVQSEYDGDRLRELLEQQKYEAEEKEFDVLDEYGNLDPEKFQAFMADNNKSIFEKAVTAVQAKAEAEQMETAAWDSVYTDYPELQGNESLEKALRGARIQDIIAGGNGDITKLAADIIGPIRDNRIKAIEDVNKTVTQQKNLSATAPSNATPEKTAPSLMSQLQTALSQGNNEAADKIRHAIRKERIYGKNET